MKKVNNFQLLTIFAKSSIFERVLNTPLISKLYKQTNNRTRQRQTAGHFKTSHVSILKTMESLWNKPNNKIKWLAWQDNSSKLLNIFFAHQSHVDFSFNKIIFDVALCTYTFSFNVLTMVIIFMFQQTCHSLLFCHSHDIFLKKVQLKV